jgi:hypothetical protein
MHEMFCFKPPEEKVLLGLLGVRGTSRDIIEWYLKREHSSAFTSFLIDTFSYSVRIYTHVFQVASFILVFQPEFCTHFTSQHHHRDTVLS